ncbi:uncharacterized protein LOC125608653 [Brassica napus]|uniref:uncharacterized protein LOC125608653 n=1 Tax=Brassica napus TaxID=3708 RepID=UPI002078B54A|nr:uncharacterized protein LOC125608653 [Brassica napus]
MCPNFLRYLLALLVRTREEGLRFGLKELRKVCLMKQNNQNPGTFIMSPRPGLQIIEGVPYHEEKWREQFFVFKVDQASMGSFDFSKLPRNCSEDIVHFGRSLMSDELWGLIEVLRRSHPHWSSFDQSRIRAAFLLPKGEGRPLVIKDTTENEVGRLLDQEEVATPSTNSLSSSRLDRKLSRRSSFWTSRSTPENKSVGESPLIPIFDSKEDDEAGAQKSPISLSLGSQNLLAACRRK